MRACATHDAGANTHALCSRMCERGKESPQVPANPANTKAEADLRCGDSSNSVPAESPQVPAVCNQSGAIWVSTDLKVWRPRDPSFIARDCQVDDRCYRRLDPAYFAWLKLRMHAVKAAADSGRVPAEAFDELRQRFNDMQSVRRGDVRRARVARCCPDDRPRVISAAAAGRIRALQAGRTDRAASESRGRTPCTRPPVGRCHSGPGAGARMDHGESVLQRRLRAAADRAPVRAGLLYPRPGPNWRGHPAVYRTDRAAAAGDAVAILQPGCGSAVG